MNRAALTCLALCLCAGVPARAQEQATLEFEAGLTHESLTRGLADWRSRYLFGEWRSPQKQSAYAGWRETQRYGLDDREAHAGGVLPLSGDTQIQLEAGASDSHRVLPARYGFVQWLHRPAEGWTLGAGFRRSVYDLGLTRVALLNIDRYLGNERVGYTLYTGGPDGSGLSSSHRLQWAHYYGDHDWLGLTLIRGRETENSGGAAFLTSQVSGLSLSGKHGLRRNWWLHWDLSKQRQGELYSRAGASLGLRHAF